MQLGLIISVLSFTSLSILILYWRSRKNKVSDSLKKNKPAQVEVTQDNSDNFDKALIELDPLFENQATLVPPSRPAEHFNDTILTKVDKQEAVTITVESPRKTPTFLAIYILPAQNNQFSLQKIISWLKDQQFYYGKGKIFHRHVADNKELGIRYSVASVKEPGTIEITANNQAKLSGIVLFMQLPQANALESFNQMLLNARQLAAALQGRLFDMQRKSFNQHSLNYYHHLLVPSATPDVVAR